MAQKVIITKKNEQKHKAVREAIGHIVADNLSHASLGRMVLVPEGQTFSRHNDPRGQDTPSMIYQDEELGNFQAFIKKH